MHTHTHTLPGNLEVCEPEQSPHDPEEKHKENPRQNENVQQDNNTHQKKESTTELRPFQGAFQPCSMTVALSLLESTTQ